MFAEDVPPATSRLVSGVVAVVYVAGGVVIGGPVMGSRMFAFCLLPLGCIWFPEAMGDYVGSYMNAPSPASFVAILGWIVLLLPVVALFLVWIRT